MYLSSHHKMEVSLDLSIQHVIKCMGLQSRDSNTQIMSSYEWVFRDCGHEWDSNIRVSKDPLIRRHDLCIRVSRLKTHTLHDILNERIQRHLHLVMGRQIHLYMSTIYTYIYVYI